MIYRSLRPILGTLIVVIAASMPVGTAHALAGATPVGGSWRGPGQHDRDARLFR